MFTSGQMLGIAAFIVLAVGAAVLLYRLDALIGGDPIEDGDDTTE